MLLYLTTLEDVLSKLAHSLRKFKTLNFPMTDEAQVKKDWERYLFEKKYEKCRLPKVQREQKKLEKDLDQLHSAKILTRDKLEHRYRQIEELKFPVLLVENLDKMVYTIVSEFRP